MISWKKPGLQWSRTLLYYYKNPAPLNIRGPISQIQERAEVGLFADTDKPVQPSVGFFICKVHWRGETMEPKEVLDFFCRRRSVRRYLKKAIPDTTLDLLMKSAMAAPSGNNAQPWAFIIVRDVKLKEELSRVHAWVYMANEAPAAIVMLGDKGSQWWQEDCAAATQNLLLAAANLGLGAVWCGIKEDQAKAVRKILGIPPEMGVLCIVPIGYPAESLSPNTKFRKDKVHWDRFTKP